MKNIVTGEFNYHLAEPAGKSGKTVVLYHGWGGSVEHFGAYAENLTQHGFRVIVPEIVYNDTRKPVEKPFELETVQAYFWKAIAESIEEFGAFQKELGVPETDIVVIGSSMGGFIASGIFARHPQIAGFASVNGSGAFVLTEQLFRERQDRSPMDTDTEGLLRKFDPMDKKPGQGAVLLINGEQDRTVPLEGHDAYFKHLTEAHQHPHTAKKLVKGVGHQFTRDMERDVANWLLEIR